MNDRVRSLLFLGLLLVGLLLFSLGFFLLRFLFLRFFLLCFGGLGGRTSGLAGGLDLSDEELVPLFVPGLQPSGRRNDADVALRGLSRDFGIGRAKLLLSRIAMVAQRELRPPGLN